MDFMLTEEQNKLKAKAREFAIREVLPVARKYDESEEFPLPVIKKAWEEKLLNLGIPKKYGGQGHGLLDACLVVEEMSSACPGMATSIFDNNLGAEPIVIGGSEEQKERILGELINEFKLIAFATSEPTMGSDVAGMKCRAEKDGDEFILNGDKFWITNGGYADYITVFATADPEKKHKGIAAFIVDTQDFRTKIMGSLLNDEPFEPVFEIGGKTVRVEKIDVEKGRLVVHFAPASKHGS